MIISFIGNLSLDQKKRHMIGKRSSPSIGLLALFMVHVVFFHTVCFWLPSPLCRQSGGSLQLSSYFSLYSDQISKWTCHKGCKATMLYRRTIWMVPVGLQFKTENIYGSKFAFVQQGQDKFSSMYGQGGCIDLVTDFCTTLC